MGRLKTKLWCCWNIMRGRAVIYRADVDTTSGWLMLKPPFLLVESRFVGNREGGISP